MSTSMCRPSAWPASEPEPGTTLKTPSGSPASDASSAIRSADIDVSRAGLMISLLPAASAGATFQVAISSGKFQGTTAPTTPIGSRTIRPRASGPVGATASKTLSIASANQRYVLTASGTSTSRVSVIGLPPSSESRSASSSRFASSRSAKRRRTSLRSAGARRDQRPSSNARRAAATAASMSAAPPDAIVAIGWPVAGFSVTNVSPDAASRNCPSMNAFVRKAGSAATAIESSPAADSPRSAEYRAEPGRPEGSVLGSASGGTSVLEITQNG